MIGYRRMKYAGLWKLSRDGYDVIYTSKVFDSKTGEEKESNVHKVTSEQIQVQIVSLESQIAKLNDDLNDLTEAKQDIKEQEAILDPDAQ